MKCKDLKVIEKKLMYNIDSLFVRGIKIWLNPLSTRSASRRHHHWILILRTFWSLLLAPVWPAVHGCQQLHNFPQPIDNAKNKQIVNTENRVNHFLELLLFNKDSVMPRVCEESNYWSCPVITRLSTEHSKRSNYSWVLRHMSTYSTSFVILLLLMPIGSQDQNNNISWVCL